MICRDDISRGGAESAENGLRMIWFGQHVIPAEARRSAGISLYADRGVVPL
jgi:hypothetical protein